MVKFGCGILMLLMGAGLAAWLLYNLLVAREREFQLSLCGLGFIGGLFYVGTNWARETWPDVAATFRPKKRKKKKKRRRVEEDDDE